VYFFESGKTLRRRCTLMRELKVLDHGHLKLSWEERKEFFEKELGEHVRSEVKRLLEEA
jgi:hypothetical protein